MAAFWLGAKLEEVIEIDSPTKLRLRDVLSVFYRTIRRREGRPLEVLDPFSKVRRARWDQCEHLGQGGWLGHPCGLQLWLAVCSSCPGMPALLPLTVCTGSLASQPTFRLGT